MTKAITETITITGETNVTRIVLRPQTLSIRNEFRRVLQDRIITNNPRLVNVPGVQVQDENSGASYVIQAIDREGFLELNNTTSSERRTEFMESVISLENNDENRLFLIRNTSNQVRIYLHDLLIRSANNSNITEEDLYRIGNIFLYTISNLDIDELILRDIIQNMRESMIIYNTDQIFSILDNQVVSSYDNYLNGLRLATETQLEERVQEFNQEVDQRMALNRKRVLYAGVGLLGSMALTSLGIPPLGGLLVRSLTIIQK